MNALFFNTQIWSNFSLCLIEDVSGGGAVSPQTQPIEFQSCIPAPWINGLLKKVFQRRIIRKFKLAKKFYPFIRSARIEIQFRVVLAQRVLGETGDFLSTFFSAKKVFRGMG